MFTSVSIQVHFSLDHFNNFVVSATVIQIQCISDLYLPEVNTHCFSSHPPLDYVRGKKTAVL